MAPQLPIPSVRTGIMNVEERYQLDGLKQRDREACTAWQGTAQASQQTSLDSVACWPASPDWLQSAFRGGHGDGPAGPDLASWVGSDAWATSSARQAGIPPLRQLKRETEAAGYPGGPLWGWASKTTVWETSPFESYNWCLPHQQVLEDVPEGAGGCGSFSRDASFASGMNLAGGGSRTHTLSDEVYNVRRFSSQESAISFNVWLP